jgi:tRNA threonylcarbamoyladenosine biosynthesis protein TsaB
MNIILSIETSIPEASVALTINGEMIALEQFESHRQQNTHLFPALESILAMLPRNKFPDLIIVGTGPGSYSGSRISIAAAQGLAIAYACPVVGICSFLGTHTMSKHQTAYAIGDARRDTFFITKIQTGNPAFNQGQTELLSLGDFCEKLTSIDTSVTPLFSFEKKLPLVHSFDYFIDKSNAAQLAKAWLDFSLETQQALLQVPPQPAYLRAPFITKAKPGHPLLRLK